MNQKDDLYLIFAFINKRSNNLTLAVLIMN